MKRIMIPTVMAVMLSGCVSDGMGTKQTMGGLIGAAGGAVVGAQFGQGNGQLVGVAIGTLLGAHAGSELGQSADRSDELYRNRFR